MFPCTYPGCNAKLKYKRGLDEHMKRHEGIYRYVCPYCDKGLGGTSNAKLHIQHHTGLYGYHCNKCQLEFPKVKLLKAHLDQKSCYSYETLDI